MICCFSAYGMLDGLFQQGLLAYGDRACTLDDFVAQVRDVMPLMLSANVSPARGAAAGSRGAV